MSEESPEEEFPTPPTVDPDAVSPDAVKDVGDKKYGWQQPPLPAGTLDDPQSCSHTGAVMARMNLSRRSVGDEWVCSCTQVFEVGIGGGGNKVLRKKEIIDEGSEE